MASIESHHTIVVPAEHVEQVREILNTAVDQIAILSIPVQTSEIDERYVEMPVPIDQRADA